MDILDKIGEAIRIVENKAEYVSAICSVCEKTGEMYVCLFGHGTLICKKCLSTEKRNNIKDPCTKAYRPLINKEEDTTCSFIPLIPKTREYA